MRKTLKELNLPRKRQGSREENKKLSKIREKTLQEIEADYESRTADRLHKLVTLRSALADTMLPRHIQFVQEYFQDFDSIRAARSVGLSDGTGTVVIHSNPKIKEYIALTRKINELTTGVTTEFVLSEYLRIAKVSIADLYDETGEIIPPHKLPPHVAACVMEVKERTWTEGKVKNKEVTYKMHPKMQALEALGKYIGFFEKDNRQKAPEVKMQFVMPSNGRNMNLVKNYQDAEIVNNENNENKK